jgi:hypothetical protein
VDMLMSVVAFESHEVTVSGSERLMIRVPDLLLGQHLRLWVLCDLCSVSGEQPLALKGQADIRQCTPPHSTQCTQEYHVPIPTA